MTVNDIVNLDTPPKNDAAPIKAKAPGSIQAHKPSVCTPNKSTITLPMILPYVPPMKLQKHHRKI